MKSIIIGVVKFAIAIGLVWFVVNQIETTDRLEIPGATEEIESSYLRGDFEGDWRSDSWTFTTEDGVEYRPPLTEGWRVLPGFFTALRSLTLSWYLLGIVLWAILLLIAAFRWQLLLRAAAVPVGYRQALKLSFIGYFFNNVMLGSTGGDLVRAVMVTRGLERNRWRAALSVVVDRLIGLFALMIIAGIVLVVFWYLQRISSVRGLLQVTQIVFVLLLMAVIGASIYLSRRARAKLGLDWLLARLPAQQLIHKLDDAITVYRDHKGTVVATVAMSIPLQLAGILSFWVIGEALGAGLTLGENFVIFPVVQTVSALPLAPAGWGVGESLYGWFFESFGSSFTLGVAVSVIFRLTTQVGFGLVGGLIWVASRERRQGIPIIREKA
ncbi:MAG: lysylphosphatidylglycerol synthase transmembrane domain-containing protein [Planctomycetota bacterium]|nr:lysylphosphatidylglycerol synthase transmembrane domain-containing protein [Planctomycetota bacterium]